MRISKSSIIKALKKGEFEKEVETWGITLTLDEDRGYYEEYGYALEEDEEYELDDSKDECYSESEEYEEDIESEEVDNQEYTDFYPFVYYIAETDIKSGPAEIDFTVKVCGLTFTRHADAGEDPTDWESDDYDLEIDGDIEEALNDVVPSYYDTMDNIEYFHLAYPTKESIAKVLDEYSDYDFFAVDDDQSESLSHICVYAREKVDERIPMEFTPISKKRAIELLREGCLKFGNGY